MLHGCVRRRVHSALVDTTARSVVFSPSSGSFAASSSWLASTRRKSEQIRLSSSTSATFHNAFAAQRCSTSSKSLRSSRATRPPFASRFYATSSIPISQLEDGQAASPLHAQQQEIKALKKQRRRYRFLYILAILGAAGVIGYYTVRPFRRLCIVVQRCTRVAYAVGACILDYKILFRTEWDDPTKRHMDYKACHKRCAERILDVLKTNGGIYVKLGQHLSSVQLVPEEWSSTMRPLQDHCFPTPLDEVQAMFLHDIGEPIEDLFSSFDPEPIGVASLAQVHIATDKLSGRRVAVKLMHPDLQEFTRLDMTTTIIGLKVVKFFFPTFEFTWLGEEMEQSLPLEMDFRHEAANAKHCVANFAKLKHTSLVVPEVLWSQERILVMEYIIGGRVDDLQYLQKHGIDRNQVSCEISRIFSQMLFIDGSFHGDPHQGNLLIRPVTKLQSSRSRFNFEIVLLDHGLWFDIAKDLRVNYARLWLSLLAPKTDAVDAERRKYAELVGNIGPDLFPIFEAAITGRAGISEKDYDDTKGLKGTLEGSLMGLATQTPEDAQRLRNAFMQEGMLESIFELLRKVPRRLLMVLKINDLTRSLDKSLNPSHPVWRVWLIVARYCCLAAHYDDIEQLESPTYRASHSRLSIVRQRFTNWIGFQVWYRGLGMVEFFADRYAKWVKVKSYLIGLARGGFREATQREAGLI